MRRLILSTVAAAVLVVGTPAALFAAPISQPHEQAAIHSTDPHVQRAGLLLEPPSLCASRLGSASQSVALLRLTLASNGREGRCAALATSPAQADQYVGLRWLPENTAWSVASRKVTSES